MGRPQAFIRRFPARRAEREAKVSRETCAVHWTAVVGWLTVCAVVAGLALTPDAAAQAPQGTGSWHALGGLSGEVFAIGLGDAGAYAGGLFEDAGGDANADRIARWDGSSWHALGGGVQDIVWAIAVDGTDVYVGGAFTDAGEDPEADYLARWDGSSWHAPGGLNGDVWAIAVDGSEVYVGGAFTDAGGDPRADYIARWAGPAFRTFLPLVLRGYR